MNIHFAQVERRSQLSSYLLAAFAIVTVLMFALRLSHYAELHWSFPSVTVPAAQVENNDLPIPIPAPSPPAEQPPAVTMTDPGKNTQSISVTQAIAVPMPSMP